MARYRSARDIDWTLVALALLLCGIGVLQIFSATHESAFSSAWWKQILWIGLGLLAMWICASIDYHHLLERVPLLYVLSLLTLVAVLLFGTQIFGSRRWIPIYGGLRLQVSEFVKLVIILLVARCLAEFRRDRIELRDLARLVGLVGLPMALVIKQPDLGTSLTYAAILLTGLFLAGLSWRYWLAGGVLAIVLLPAVWTHLKDYQKERINAFVNPGRDPRGAGYQVIQSKIAIGSGGLWGQGTTQGSQTQLRFLPVPHTDFIFSAFGEEHGFVGVVVALGLYFLLLMQIVHNAQTAPDRAGMYVCMCVAGLVLFQVFVNVGMVVGRMPVTGLPLPFISYGGSNTISVFAMLGLVNSVRLQRFGN